MTLNDALAVLGYRSLFVLNYEHLEENLLKYDAFTHTPLASIYKDLDNRFPNSKFILNIRERESWLRAIERQWSAKGTTLVEKEREIRLRTYGTAQFSREILEQVYNQHLEEVSRYFKDRNESLLVLDVCAGEGFEKMCPFLGEAIPPAPFPHKNSARDTFERPAQKLKRFLIRYLKARRIKQFLKHTLHR